MPMIHGSKGRVYFNSQDVSGFLTEASLSGTTDAAETTTMGATAKTYIAGQRDRPFSASGLYDPALTVVRDSLGAASGVLTYCPGGASAIGDLAWLASSTSIQYDESDPIGGAVAFAWSVQPSGPVAFGYVLHPLGTDTNTTTGAERDDGAATATGWVAHLHVSAVTAGSWAVKLQDAAVSNTYSDLASGTFTAATGATSQRLTSATSTTALRRYVRYVATRTGGSAGDSITFQLSISRIYNP